MPKKFFDKIHLSIQSTVQRRRNVPCDVCVIATPAGGGIIIGSTTNVPISQNIERDYLTSLANDEEDRGCTIS